MIYVHCYILLSTHGATCAEEPKWQDVPTNNERELKRETTVRQLPVLFFEVSGSTRTVDFSIAGEKK